MSRIVTFGEIMLRISPLSAEDRLIQTSQFRIEPGGSESNVAIALAELGEETSIITKLPDSSLSEIIYRYLKMHGVDTSNIIEGGKRLGTYYTESGTGPRPSFVEYDRDDSAFSDIHYPEIDVEKIIQNYSWFHTSGITPALTENTFKVLDELLICLKEHLLISVDLNYRNKLWNWVSGDRQDSIKNVMRNICSNAHLIVANETDIQNVFGYDPDENDDAKKYVAISDMLFKDYPDLKAVAISLRKSHSADRNTWSGMYILRDGGYCSSSSYILNNIVDRVGTGDTFAAGIIYGMINNFKPQSVIDFAVALSALKHTVRGDASQFKKSDVEHLLNIGSNGRIIR